MKKMDNGGELIVLAFSGCSVVTLMYTEAQVVAAQDQALVGRAVQSCIFMECLYPCIVYRVCMWHGA